MFIFRLSSTPSLPSPAMAPHPFVSLVASTLTAAIHAQYGFPQEPIPPLLAALNNFGGHISAIINAGAFEQYKTLGELSLKLAVLDGLLRFTGLSLSHSVATEIANGIDLDALLLSHLAYLTRYPFHLLPSEVSAQSWVLVFVTDEKYTHDVLSGWLRALLNRPFASVQAVITAPDVALPPSETIAQDTVAVINNLLNLSRGVRCKYLRSRSAKVKGLKHRSRGLALPPRFEPAVKTAVASFDVEEFQFPSMPEAATWFCTSRGHLQTIGRLLVEAVVLKKIHSSGCRPSSYDSVLSAVISPLTITDLLDRLRVSRPGSFIHASHHAAAFYSFIGRLYAYKDKTAFDLRIPSRKIVASLEELFGPVIRACAAEDAPIIVSYLDIEWWQYYDEKKQYERELRKASSTDENVNSMAVDGESVAKIAGVVYHCKRTAHAYIHHAFLPTSSAGRWGDVTNLAGMTVDEAVSSVAARVECMQLDETMLDV
ncbi:hypothetical protein C8J57DRAFT_1408348 [Mycena rebaudengoi]|nr:hypothetical protein C8J57DRAFT_1408348 [Mycena rebaudengoi]